MIIFIDLYIFLPVGDTDDIDCGLADLSSTTEETSESTSQSETELSSLSFSTTPGMSVPSAGESHSCDTLDNNGINCQSVKYTSTLRNLLVEKYVCLTVT